MSLNLDRMIAGEVTELGKLLRWLRMNRSEVLYDMAVKLKIGSAELSVYEYGKKQMGGELIGRIISAYDLDNELAADLLRMAQTPVRAEVPGRARFK